MAGNPAQIYQDEMVRVIFDPWAQVLVEALDIEPGSAVLDVACGTGAVTRRLVPLVGESGRVSGLDISPFMLEVAKSIPVTGGGSIEWYEASAMDMPFENATFDNVVCQQGFQFTPDKQGAANEFYRVMKAGGQLGLAIWDSMETNPYMQVTHEALLRHLGSGLETPFSYSNSDQIRQVLSEARFNDIEIDSANLTLKTSNGHQFRQAAIMGAASVLPELKGKSPAELMVLANAVLEDIADFIDEHTVDGVYEMESRSMLIKARK